MFKLLLYINFSHGFLLHLLRGSKHVVHALEALLPAGNFDSDGLPFFFANLTKHVAVDNKFFVNLVDLSVDNSVGDGFNGPLFNVILGHLNICVNKRKKTYIQQRSDFLILEVSGLLGTQLADLQVALLQNHLFFSDALFLQETAVFAKLIFEVLGVSGGEGGKQFN